MNNLKRKHATLEEKYMVIGELEHSSYQVVAKKYNRSLSCIKRWESEYKRGVLGESTGSGRPKMTEEQIITKNMFDKDFLQDLNDDQKDEALEIMHKFLLWDKSRK